MGSIVLRLGIEGLTPKELRVKIAEADDVLKHLVNPPIDHIGAYQDREGHRLPIIAEKLERWRLRKAELLRLLEKKHKGRIIVPQQEAIA